MRLGITTAILCAGLAAFANSDLLEWDEHNVPRSNPQRVTVRAGEGNTLIAEFRTSEPWPYIVLKPKNGTTWNLSKYREISFDVENLDHDRQCEIEFNAGMWSRGYLGTGLLRPGEKRTFRFRLHHRGSAKFSPLFNPRARFLPDGFEGGKNLDTSKLESFQLISSFPVRCQYRLSNIRLWGKANPPETPEERSFFPFIDRYGQNIHADWPEKVRSDADLRGRREKESAHLKPRTSGWDRFGGWADGPKLEAKGFFHPAKFEGKWYLIDPEGRLFFSRGVNEVGPESFLDGLGREKSFAERSSRGDHGYSILRDNLRRKYGDDFEPWYELQPRRLDSWGFNTVGNWSDERFYRNPKQPYTLNLPLPKCPYIGGVPDVFSAEFEAGMKDLFGKKYAFVIGDPWCIGVFIGNEFPFGPIADETQIARNTLECGPEQPARKAFLAELRKKYRSVDDLNRAWGSRFSGWDGIRAEKGDAAKQDLREFNRHFLDRLFRLSREAVKRRSPDTLYLGSRLMNDDYFSPSVNQIAARYCDVVSYNLYPIGFERFKPAGLPDVPVLISESTVGHASRGTYGTIVNPGTEPGARLRALARQLESAFLHPQIVGIHHFKFADQVLTGRWDGENYGLGLIDITDTPYEDFAILNRAASEQLYKFRTSSRTKTLNLP